MEPEKIAMDLEYVLHQLDKSEVEISERKVTTTACFVREEFWHFVNQNAIVYININS